MHEAVIAAVGSTLLHVLVPSAVALTVRYLGREKFLSTDSINGCNWWPLAVVASTATVALAARWWGRSSLVLFPVDR